MCTSSPVFCPGRQDRISCHCYKVAHLFLSAPCSPHSQTLPPECQRVWNLLEATFQAYSISPRHFRFLCKPLSISLGFYPPFIHPAAHCLTFLGENQRTREKQGIPRVWSPGIFSDKVETTRCVQVWQPTVE